MDDVLSEYSVPNYHARDYRDTPVANIHRRRVCTKNTLRVGSEVFLWYMSMYKCTFDAITHNTGNDEIVER
jgi:hypothetical protein